MPIRAPWFGALIPLLLAGCACVPPSARRALASGYKPANVYQRQSALPLSMRRVAVLPVPRSRQNTVQAAGADSLQPVFISELRKRDLFEIVTLPSGQLRSLTGRESWTADDELPRDFFEKLHAATGCDAVLFVELTRFQPYPPLQIGWKARLVDCYERQTWWAFDGVFDAGSTRVLAGAKAYARSHLNLPNVLLDGASVISSPGRFGQYTAHITARTLPDGPLFAKASWDIADRSEK